MWADPTDLFALVALPISWRFVGRERRAFSSRATMGIGVVALVLCAASGSSSPAPRYPFLPRGVLRADVVVRHMGSENIEVGVRRLRDDVRIDCDDALDDPTDAIEGGAFGEEQRWTLAQGDAIPLWDRASSDDTGEAIDRDCYAVQLRSHGEVWWLSWRHGAPAIREAEIRLEPNERPEPEAVTIRPTPNLPAVPVGVTVRRAP